jgi:hypothetical protein
MNVEIGAEAALFPEKEYIKGIFFAVLGWGGGGWGGWLTGGGKMENLLEKVLCPGAEHELLVDLHVELAALALQLPAACCRPRVRTLQQE